MRISSKGRYALASMISMAQSYSSGEYITVISISEKLGISKIYLEQVFALLKRGGLVTSVKGAQGGYLLARMPQQITVFDVLSASELSLFEKAEDTVPERAPDIEQAMRLSAFNTLDQAIQKVLEKTSLSDLVLQAQQYQSQGLMFFI